MKFNFIKQRDAMQCGAACIAMILNYYEIDVPFHTIASSCFYRLQAGWSNSTWNFQLQLANLARWHWRSDKSVMHNKIEQTYSIDDHAMARLAFTYTFGFGKKVERGSEASQQSGVNSGILK